jgi:3'(2'), 5'-bisphosphate nucleotidase
VVSLSPGDMPDDHDVARLLAGQAGARLLDLRARSGASASLGADGDRLSHEYLVGELARLRPADAVLSEEGADDQGRLSANRVWIIDPLDGTREFGERGRADWAVHVALWQDGQLTAGAVALPAAGTVRSIEAGTVLSTAEPPAPREDSGQVPLRILVSRSRPPEFVERLASDLGAQLVPMGSAGAKAAAVILGEADAYVHAGGQYEWDSAAPVAVARAAALHASRIDGSPLRYNQADPSVPDIVICPKAIAPTLLSAIKRSQHAGHPGWSADSTADHTH